MQKNDENLLNPERPLTLDMAKRFMKKHKDYYEVKRNLIPTGQIIPAQTKSVLYGKATSARE